MKFLSSLFRKTDVPIQTLQPVIDLQLFSVNNSRLKKPISTSDDFYHYFKANDVLNLPDDGIEIGTNNDVLDYICITIDKFKGKFQVDGKETELSGNNTPQTIIEHFGEPYWIDNSDKELIQFYEYREGSIELQFEFSDSIHLTYISLMVDGVLSTEEQRNAYNVTKPWPPEYNAESC